MRKLFWTFAGRMALSIVTSIAGALVVTQLGLLEPKSSQKLERIVFDSDLTRAEESALRVEAAHIALRDHLAAQRAEGERRAARPAEQPSASEALAQAHRPAPAQERRKATAQRRDMAAPPTPTAPSTPLVITPAIAQETPARPARTPLEGMFDKLASGVGRIRDAIIDAVKIDKPSTLPFGAASVSSSTLPAIGDLRERIRLPLVDM
jgi:hypothetical protein